MKNSTDDNRTEWEIEDIEAILGLKSPIVGQGASEASNEAFPSPDGNIERDGLENLGDIPARPARLGKNPWAKLALILLVTGIGAAFFGSILFRGADLNLGRGRTTAVPLEPRVEPDRSGKEDTLIQRNAKLTGKLALARQEEQLKAIRHKIDGANEKLPKVSMARRAPVPVPIKNISDTAGPAARRYSPAYRTRDPVSPPTVISREFTPAGFPKVPPPVSRGKEIVRAELPPVDDSDRWLELAGIGSYGNGEILSREDSGAERETAAPEPIPGEEKKETPPTVETGGQRLQIGQRVRARLITPIFWTEGMGETRFVVRLSEAALDVAGKVILPPGTEVVFSSSAIAPNGLVNGRAIALIVGDREYPLPPDAFTVTEEGGKPLVAGEGDNDGDLAGDALSFILGSLSETGEILNRPDSVSSFTGTGGVSSSVSFGGANYLGAILEGGFAPLIDRLRERERRRVNRSKDRPALWSVENGKSLQLFVNRSFFLGDSREDR